MTVGEEVCKKGVGFLIVYRLRNSQRVSKKWSTNVSNAELISSDSPMKILKRIIINQYFNVSLCPVYHRHY